MAFKVGGAVYYFYLNTGRGTLRLSTGTRLLAQARVIEHAVSALGPRGRDDREILEALAARRLTAREVARAVGDGTLDALRASLRDVDLAPLVSEWAKTLTLRPRTQREYVATVRKLIPEGTPFPLSRFTKGALQRYLDRWTTATRNRYRDHFSHFARWLVARELLAYNPVLQTVRAPEADPRIVWYTPDEARRLIDALPEPYRALEALMAGCAIDLGAVLALTRADVNEERRTVFSHGPAHAKGRLKTRHRVRHCVVTEAWCWSIFVQHARRFVGAARLFPHTHHTGQNWHRKAVAATGLAPSWPRDWRHSFAVWHRLRGTPDWQIAAYLGHPTTLMVQTRYARFTPDEAQLSYRRFEGRP